jgi:hypothetical protein
MARTIEERLSEVPHVEGVAASDSQGRPEGR